VKTKTLSAKTIRNAISVAGGLFSMNARSACGYAFTKNKKNDGVNCGEFIYSSELPDVTADRFDGYISFDDKTLHDLNSTETAIID